MKVMYIYTSNETYPVKLETGEITRQGSKQFSGGWKFKAFRHVIKNQWIRLDEIQKNPAILASVPWRFKNGKGERVLGVYFGEL